MFRYKTDLNSKSEYTCTIDCKGLAWAGEGGRPTLVERPFSEIQSIYADRQEPDSSPGGQITVLWKTTKVELANRELALTPCVDVGMIQERDRPQKPILTPNGFLFIGQLARNWGASDPDSHPSP